MTGSEFIRENFDPNDRLAVVLLNKRSQEVIQRLASAEAIAAEDFQTWLRFKNSEQFEIYLSVNVLKDSADGRTKADVGQIRHVFLDFDNDGTAAVERLLARSDLTKPNYVVNTSPDKWQVIWKVEQFDPEQAERLQKGLSRETGADIAATDCARVLRLPGFYNHKYALPHLVNAEKLTDDIYRPEQFPEIAIGGPDRSASGTYAKRNDGKPVSQSERDWAFARLSLARGDAPEDVVTAIATYRRFEKPNPQYYAQLTVQKAAESLAPERSVTGPDR